MTLMILTCKQFGKHCSSCQTTINSLRPYITIGTQQPIKMKLGILNEHNTKIIVNVVVNNVVLVKQQYTVSGSVFSYLRKQE